MSHEYFNYKYLLGTIYIKHDEDKKTPKLTSQYKSELGQWIIVHSSTDLHDVCTFKKLDPLLNESCIILRLSKNNVKKKDTNDTQLGTLWLQSNIKLSSEINTVKMWISSSMDIGWGISGYYPETTYKLLYNDKRKKQKRQKKKLSKLLKNKSISTNNIKPFYFYLKI